MHRGRVEIGRDGGGAKGGNGQREQRGEGEKPEQRGHVLDSLGHFSRGVGTIRECRR